MRLEWVKSGTQTIISLYPSKNICDGYSMESPPLYASNEHHKMFLYADTRILLSFLSGNIFNKTCVKRSVSKRQTISFQYQLSLNTGQKYCRMHSAIL